MSKSTPPSQIQDSKAAPTVLGLSTAEGVGVDKIRDLLFGSQMQDYERRFSDTEERFLQKIKELDSETTRSLSSLDASTNKQLESLANQLREEKDLRSDGDKGLERTLREQTQSLDKRLGQLSDQAGRLEREFTDRLAKESQHLREEIKHKSEEMRYSLEKMFAELSNVKTDRNLLAGLFLEVAKCLNQDFGPKLLGKGAKGVDSDHP